jgi:hypothetical protein
MGPWWQESPREAHRVGSRDQPPAPLAAGGGGSRSRPHLAGLRARSWRASTHHRPALALVLCLEPRRSRDRPDLLEA